MVTTLKVGRHAAGKDDSAFDAEASAPTATIARAEKLLQRRQSGLKDAYAAAQTQLLGAAAVGILDPVARRQRDALGAALQRVEGHLDALQALRAGDAMPAMVDALGMAQQNLLLGGKQGQAATDRSYELRQVIAAHLQATEK
ncbi:MAG: hypothetical protein EOO40_11080 [Deltaproteobacteria bacterium]|nr:MAG: hypothetical protein EOO40_11080 [Deltaproteobacteria bacterium]